MFTRVENEPITSLQGKLELIISRTLIFPPNSGLGRAPAIQQQSDDVLLVDHGSFYPALQRQKHQGWVKAKRGVSTNTRKASFEALTKSGRKHLVGETTHWRMLVFAIGHIVGPLKVEG